jgi:phenylalanyl-tRNA synthetase alpha chain
MNLQEELERIGLEMRNYTLQNRDDISRFKQEIAGKNGAIQAAFEHFRLLPADEKKALGGPLNQLKQAALKMVEEAEQRLLSQSALPQLDPSLPGFRRFQGSLHPLTLIQDEVSEIFSEMGFSLSDGPEIEHNWFNFTALNFPEDHPARDMQDTFFIQGNPEYLLRTHTSGVQVRTMTNAKPPIRILSPGRVFRCDSDATHSPVFHQIEGLYIDKQVSFADLKDILFHFVERFFGADRGMRFRPSYFPFTEPSAEMDIAWGERWMEILGCGMVDPRVLENCGIDSSVYRGFAFGMGVERLAMLRYRINDIRLFYENDLRFLEQFR